MNAKQSKALRKITDSLTIGKSIEESRVRYRKAKKIYVNKSTQSLAKPILQRNPMKNIVGGKLGKKAIPICNPIDKKLNKVVKGFLGLGKRKFKDKTPRRYHPTKGFKKDSVFDLSYELELQRNKSLNSPY